MTELIDDIPDSKRSDFLASIFTNYIEKQGLGGIPKSDFDALIVYLYAKHSKGKFNAFELGQKLKIKESRVKSLYESALLKYSELTEGTAWIEILKSLRTTNFELESFERSQIRFKFENPAHFKYFQNRIRIIGSTATYSPTYETLTITLNVFFEVLEHVYSKSESQFAATETDEIQPLVGEVIEQIGKSLGKRRIKELRSSDGIKTKAGQALDNASKLAGIGSMILAMA